MGSEGLPRPVRRRKVYIVAPFFFAHVVPRSFINLESSSRVLADGWFLGKHVGSLTSLGVD